MLTAVQSRLQAFRKNLDPMVPMMLVGALVGVMGSIAVEGFRQAMYAIIHLYSAHEHLVAAARGLPLWMRVLVPLAGATVGGLIMWGGHRWIKQPRGPEYMEAVRVGDGVLPFAPNITRTLSSLAGVSGGITIGREGTMIQFAALISSIFGRFTRHDPEHRRLIVACGAAAGFAGAYHAPIAGTMFVSEIILGGLALREITAILVAAVMGELTTQALFATGPLYLAHTIPAVGFPDLIDATLLGVLCGLLGPAFLWLLDNARRRYQSAVTFVPMRMALAGLAIGLLSLVRPEVWGNGYSVVQSFLVHHWVVSTVMTVFVLRLLAVTVASAAGIPGGVLTPTLSLGGALGLIAYHTLLTPTATHSQALWVLVGMGSLLAATTHAPAMSAIMVFETTRNYNVVLAAMPACVVASVIGSLIRSRSVYTEALGREEDASKPSLFDAITGRRARRHGESGAEEAAAVPVAEQEPAGVPGLERVVSDLG
ncbi:MAG: chloride channel protein, partial [Acidiferrobacterales bacterium]